MSGDMSKEVKKSADKIVKIVENKCFNEIELLV
jgi:hypothetical protein